MRGLPRSLAHLPGRDILLALAVFAVGATMYSLNFYELLGPQKKDIPLWVRLLVLGWASVGQTLRNRAPRMGVGIAASAAIVDVSLGPSAPVMIVLMDLVHLTTLRGSRRTRQVMVAAVALAFVAAVVAASTLTEEWRLSLLGLLQVFSLLVVPAWWALNVRQHTEMAIAERANAQQLAKIAELDRRASVNAERARMARDLHDVVVGHLSAIAIQSEALLSMADGDPETVRTVLRSVRENSISSLTEMRAMIEVLRAEDTDDGERHTAPARLAELSRLVDSARAAGLRVELSGGEQTSLPVAVDLAAYRIVQEALTNAVKHAAGSCVRVELSQEKSRLVVAVSNNINGSGIPHGTGTGLVSMDERAQAVGGTFSAGRVGDLWNVRAELPTEGTNE